MQDASTVEPVPFQRLPETLTSSRKQITAHPSAHPVPGAQQSQKTADDLVQENHFALLQRAAVREPLWNLAGPAGAGRVIYDPDQLFRKQKLTRGRLGCSFEVHGFVFLQLSPSPNSSWFFLPASFSSPLGLSSPHFYPPATLSAWIFMISNKNISRSATEVPDCDLENKGNILSTSPTSWNLCFTFEILFIFECRE